MNVINPASGGIQNRKSGCSKSLLYQLKRGWVPKSDVKLCDLSIQFSTHDTIKPPVELFEGITSISRHDDICTECARVAMAMLDQVRMDVVDLVCVGNRRSQVNFHFPRRFDSALYWKGAIEQVEAEEVAQGRKVVDMNL